MRPAPANEETATGPATSGATPAGVLVIVNPRAEGVSPELVGSVTRECARRLGPVRVHRTERPGHASALAAALAGGPGPDGGGPAGSGRSSGGASGGPAGVPVGGLVAVVAVGGDGTAREVAEGLAGTPAPAPLFVVPAGTANSCYRTLWGDLPWPEALATALADPDPATRWVDLARLAPTGALVLAGACAGFPPQAIHEARAITDRTGRARYEAALHALVPRFAPYPGRVLVDGTVVHQGPTLLANVGGSRYRGGQFELLPHSALDDGLLDVCVIGGEHRPAEMLGLTRDGGHLGRPGVVYARGRRVTLERTDGRPLWFEHDGEVLVDVGDRFTLEVLPGAVPVLAGPGVDPAAPGAEPAGRRTARPPDRRPPAGERR